MTENIGDISRGNQLNTAITAIIGLILLKGITSGGYAQNSEWDDLYNEAESLYQQGQYDRALVVAEKTLKVAENEFDPDHPSVFNSLQNLALRFFIQGI